MRSPIGATAPMNHIEQSLVDSLRERIEITGFDSTKRRTPSVKDVIVNGVTWLKSVQFGFRFSQFSQPLKSSAADHDHRIRQIGKVRRVINQQQVSVSGKQWHPRSWTLALVRHASDVVIFRRNVIHRNHTHLLSCQPPFYVAGDI